MIKRTTSLLMSHNSFIPSLNFQHQHQNYLSTMLNSLSLRYIMKDIQNNSPNTFLHDYINI